MNLVGRTVSNGVALLSDLLPRMHNIQKLTLRIVQRMLNPPYRARVPNNVRNRYPTFAATPRSGSFAVSLRLGHPTAQQQAFPGFVSPSEIVAEFVDLMEIVNNGNIEEIEQRIPQPAYQDNFIGLARTLAPDGRRIRQVGFVAHSDDGVRAVAVTRPSSQIRPIDTAKSAVGADRIEVSGMLRYADASSSQNRIKIIAGGGRSHDIRVPPGMMDDIVRPMWNLPVTVVGTRRANQKIINLHDIWQSDDRDANTSSRIVGRMPSLF